MAKRRCIPTDLFFQPRFVALADDTTRLVFIGLITDADDYGRGLADTRLLGRKLDQRPETIATAMQELAETRFVQCYGSHEERYYALCAWSEWQTLSKPTPSDYPPPPDVVNVARMGFPRKNTLSQENPEKPRDVLREEEEELNRTEEEGEEETEPTCSAVLLPDAETNAAAAVGVNDAENTTETPDTEPIPSMTHPCIHQGQPMMQCDTPVWLLQGGLLRLDVMTLGSHWQAFPARRAPPFVIVTRQHRRLTCPLIAGISLLDRTKKSVLGKASARSDALPKPIVRTL